MGIFGIIVKFGLLVAVLKLWACDGPKTALISVAVWGIGFLVFPHLGLSSYYFLAFEAILAAILLLIAQVRTAL